MMWQRACVLGMGPLLLLGALVAQPKPSQLSVAKYTTWNLVTPKPVDMSPQIAISCIGPGVADRAPNPHIKTVFRVWVNPKGKSAMAKLGRGTFPVGSVIVKEKFERGGSEWRPHSLGKDEKPVLLTAMIKRKAGFDPKTGDWEFFVGKPGTRLSSDGTEHCQKCHQSQPKTDFVFGQYGSIQHGGLGWYNDGD